MSNKRSLIVMCLSLYGYVDAHDLPVFYRAPILGTQSSGSIEDWHSAFSVAYLQGQANHGWDEDGHKSALFNTWGLIDVTTLGLGVQKKVAPMTSYWNDSGTGSFDTTTFSDNDGIVGIAGTSKVRELNFSFRQNLFSGFYLYGYMPIRSIKNDDITVAYHGSNSSVQAFLGDNFNGDFATILSIYGYGPLTTSYKKTELSDVLLVAGWEGSDNSSFNFIDSLKGGAEVGVTVPCGKKQDQFSAVAIPTGYDGHWGFKAKLAGEIGFLKICALGGETNATVFLKDDRRIRMKTDVSQSGILALDSGFAHVDRGAMWGASGYAKITPIDEISCLFGVSFVRQEKTMLDVQDDIFLSTAVASSLVPNDAGYLTHPILSKYAVVNTDQRLQAWEIYTLHFKVTTNIPGSIKTMFVPALSLEYSYPIWGTHVFPCDVIAGNINATLQWKF